MKKAHVLLFLTMFLFASLLAGAGVVAQDPAKVLTPTEKLKRDPKSGPPLETVVADPGRVPPVKAIEAPDKNEPDPSMVYGYIALVDPASGQKHLILNNDYDPPVAHGYPSFSFIFSHRGTKEERRVTFRLGEGLTQIGVAGQSAYLYGAELRQDRGLTGDPIKINISGRTLTRAIRYNPDTWQFLTVEMGPYADFKSLSIDLVRREKPFSEFANLP